MKKGSLRRLLMVVAVQFVATAVTGTATLGEEVIISGTVYNPRFTFSGDGGPEHLDCPVLTSSFDCGGGQGNDSWPLALVKSPRQGGYAQHHYYYSMRWLPVQDTGTLDNPAPGCPGPKIPKPQTTYRNVGRWTPVLAKTGCYSVSAYIPWNSTSHANYLVHDVLGDHWVLDVPQHGPDGPCEWLQDWVGLPQGQIYQFNAGSDGYVELSDETSDPPDVLTCVAFDAMRFALEKPATIAVQVYKDLNLDQQYQQGEPLVTGYDVALYEGTGCGGQPLGVGSVQSAAGWVYDDSAVLRFNTSYSARILDQPCTPHAHTTLAPDGTCGATIYVPICLGSITVYKYEDCNMNGVQDPGERMLEGWPVKLTAPAVNDYPALLQYATTDSDGKAVFGDLRPGTYTVSEEGEGANSITWEKVQSTCNGVTYCDWRTTWNGRRWQATSPGPADDCASAAAAPQISDIVIECDEAIVSFGNVPLGTVTAFKFHDLNMSQQFDGAQGELWTEVEPDGKWTNQEPFTDTNCNGVQDDQEYFYDRNGNEQWDPAEPFEDLDGDSRYDWAECPIGNWPIALTGVCADGRPVCASGHTDNTGYVVFADVPPSGPEGYTLAESLVWCEVQQPSGSVWRASYSDATLACTGGADCAITRWQATTPIELSFQLPCGDDYEGIFGNICLAPLTGTKLFYDDGIPPQGTGTPRSGWPIYLAGTDPLGNQVIPSYPECTPLPQSLTAPIDIPCRNPVWYWTQTDAQGRFAFVDLLPGHYHLMEQVDPNYRLIIDKPALCGFDMMCCPQSVQLQNIKKGLAWKVYQVYPASSGGDSGFRAGYSGTRGDAITAMAGILAIDPGDGWENYKQGTMLCRETPPKDTILVKQFESFSQCADVFPPVEVWQHGTGNIRLWWPLMYEPPTTTWTLRLLYGSRTPVQYPGEQRPGWAHYDEWKWVVDTDIPHMLLYLDLLHELPFGTDEVPLLSDEMVYTNLKDILTEVGAAADAGDTGRAGDLLGQFELTVMDSCIATSPPYPNPTGFGTGIAQTAENPACCKLLVDAEYVGRRLRALQPAMGMSAD